MCHEESTKTRIVGNQLFRTNGLIFFKEKKKYETVPLVFLSKKKRSDTSYAVWVLFVWVFIMGNQRKNKAFTVVIRHIFSCLLCFYFGYRPLFSTVCGFEMRQKSFFLFLKQEKRNRSSNFSKEKKIILFRIGD